MTGWDVASFGKHLSDLQIFSADKKIFMMLRELFG